MAAESPPETRGEPSTLKWPEFGRGEPPDFKWKWPLTHAERIVELQELLTTRYWTLQYPNIQGAIDYHSGFPADELCSRERTHFTDGKLVPREDIKFPFWMEVKPPSYLNIRSYAYLIYRAATLGGCNLE
jgi:hypothetical protein